HSRRHPMRSPRFSVTAAAWSLATLAAAVVSSRSALAQVGPTQIRPWIAAHHPSIYDGDKRINALFIVVDTNEAYVASVADSLPADVCAAIDAGFAFIVAHAAVEGMADDLVAGKLRV